MDTAALKMEALAWLRFGKKLHYVSTEAGYWNADVLGASLTQSVEVEVKVSKADLKREFTSKREKHFLYQQASEGVTTTRSVPNYFYFYVPEKLEQEAKEIVAAEAPKAGLAVYYGHYAPGTDKNTKVIIKAKKLHDRPPTEVFLDTLLKRMGSELCGRHLVDYNIRQGVLQQLTHMSQVIGETLRDQSWTPDFEMGRTVDGD